MSKLISIRKCGVPGRDIQLEKAVEVTLNELKRNPMKKPANGAFPNYQKP